MNKTKEMFDYHEVQGIIKNQQTEEESIQVFLFFDNLKWDIPTNLPSEPVGFKYDMELAETYDGSKGNTVTMTYHKTDINVISKHVIDCLVRNYENEERNKLFTKFIKLAEEKFVSADIQDLTNIIHSFSSDTKSKEVDPESKEEESNNKVAKKGKINIR